MESIVIVDGCSSAILYFQEALTRGLQPIVVNPPYSECAQSENFRQAVGDRAIFINVDDDSGYDAMLAELRKYDIICVVSGGDNGVRYADRLADDLGLIGNGSDSTWRRRTKAGMNQSLEEAGIRSIKTAVINSEEDIIRFWKENDLRKAMMKYSENASSVGNKVCFSAEEAIEHFHKLYGKRSSLGVFTDVLLQEFIEGDEYIVNTVSCEGKHMITDIWKYNKVLTAGNDVVYESSNLIMRPDPGIHELIRYTYEMLDATKVKYGACHNELKVDHKGPVLIEINARPMGASMTAEYLDEALGHHIADISLDSYLNKNAFEARRAKPYRPRKMASLKTIIVNEERDGNLMPLQFILNSLSSYRHTNPIIENKTIHMVKTKDLDDSPLFIKLCHEDPNVVRDECEFLHMLEVKYPEMIFDSEMHPPAVKMRHDPFGVLEYLPRTAKVLLDTNEGSFVNHVENRYEVDEKSWDKYDVYVIAISEETSLSERYHHLARGISQLRNGGLVIIYPEMFEEQKNGSARMEIMLRMLRCDVEIPMMETDGVIYAVKQ